MGLGVLAGALLMFVPLCGSYGLWDPWETHYAEAARQIVVRGDWWTLYWEDDYFFSKPVLLFWMMGASFSLLGVTDFAARLPVALSAVVGLVAVYWGVSAATRSRLTGALAAAATASAPLYAFIGRQCITDMPFVASMIVAMMALVRYELGPAPRRARHLYLFYFACGLATLAKGPLGLLLPGAVVLSYLVLSGDWGFLRRAKIPTGALVFLATAGPWYGAMLALHGERFYNEFIVYNNVQRATGLGVHGARLDLLYYVRRALPTEPGSGGPWLQTGTWPWIALLPAALFTYVVRRVVLLGARRRGLAPPSDEERGRLGLAVLLLSWALVSVVVFSLIPTKFNHYLLPIAPALAMVAALWLVDAARGRVGEPAAAAGLLLAAGIVAWIAGLLGREPWSLLNLFIYHYGRTDLEQFEVGAVYRYGGYAIALLLAVSALLRRLRLPLAAGATACALGLAVHGIDHYLVLASDCVSQREAFDHYRAERRPGDQLINYQMNYRGEVFYGRSEAVKATGRTHLRWLLSRADRSFVVGNSRVYASMMSALRSISGTEPRVLNPATCSTRMVLHDGPPVPPPEFRPPAGALVESVPASARRDPVRIGPDISLVGAEGRWLGSGEGLTAEVDLYLRCERETEQWWKVFLHGESPSLPGRRAISDHTAVGDAYPSVAWRRGEILLDSTRLRVGWILEAQGGEGELRIAAGLFHDESRARITPAEAQDGENRVFVGRLGEARPEEEAVVDAPPDDVTLLEPPVRLGDIATLLAAEVRLVGSVRAPAAEVVLYLRAERRTADPWRVFVHAVGAGGQRRVSDHPPASPRIGTTRWERGRVYVDRTVLDLAGMPRGPVTVHTGLFSGGRRAPVSPESVDAGQSRVSVGEIEVP